MEIIRSFFSDELIEAMGWTLFHSVWQGAIVAMALLAVLYLFQKFSARVRYLLAYSSLLVFLTWTITGFAASYNYAVQKNDLKEAILNQPGQIVSMLTGKLNADEAKQTTSMSGTNYRWLEFRAAMQRNFHIVFSLWLVGVFYFLFRMTGGMLYLVRLRNYQTFLPPSEWVERVEGLKNKLGLKQKVAVMQSALSKIPLVIGHLKPVILMPVSLFTGLSRQELEAVIAHELAHIRRHDYLLNIGQSLVETLFFYNPAVWLISKTIRDEREHSCDELAISITGDKINYMKALASATELAINRHQQYAVAFGTRNGSLLNRVKRIKNHKTMKNNVTEGFLAASLIFISLILLSFTIDGEQLKKGEGYERSTNTTTGTSAERIPLQTTSQKQAAAKMYRDSLNYRMAEVSAELDDLPEEMEKLIEIAYTENDEELSLLIMNSIEAAMNAVDMEQIMLVVESAMQELILDSVVSTSVSANGPEIESLAKASAEEALRIAQKSIEAIDISAIVTSALEVARIAIEDINIEAIVNEALVEARISMEQLDHAAIKREALEASQEALREAEIDHEEIQNELEEARRTIEMELENLQREQESARREAEKRESTRETRPDDRSWEEKLGELEE
jgi:beta-lactamase regulating signal transducer with metallopeptidase domain